MTDKAKIISQQLAIVLLASIIVAFIAAWIAKKYEVHADHVTKGFEWLTKLMTLAGSIVSFLGLSTGLTRMTGGELNMTNMSLTGVGLGGLVACSALTMSEPGDKVPLVALGVVALAGMGAAIGVGFGWAKGR